MFIEDVDVSVVLVAASCAVPSGELASVEPHAHKAPRHKSHAFLMRLLCLADPPPAMLARCL